MRFTFTGKIGLNGLETKNPYLREGKTQKGMKYKTFNLSVSNGKANRGYCELFGSETSNIKTMDKDGNKVEIAWADRFDEDVVKEIASYKKNVINLDGENRKEFISPYDAVEYLAANAEALKDKKFTVTGQIQKNVYKGKITDRFTIQNIYAAADDVKEKLQVNMELYFNKDSIDATDWGTEKKLYINGYTQEYIDKENPKKYVAQQVVFDCSKIDFTNEKHLKLLQLRLRMIGCEYADGKIKTKLKNSNYYKIAMITTYQNGAEETEFTEDMLTPVQKEYVELGIKKLEDFRPAGSIYGNKVTIYKYSDVDLRGDYVDGYVDTDMKPSEFEDDIYTVAPEETEDVIEMTVPEEKTEDTSVEEDLFG